MTPAQRLERIVETLLYGPGGDPDGAHCLGAAHALKLAQELGHPEIATEEVITYLRGGNIYTHDYLKDVGYA